MADQRLHQLFEMWDGEGTGKLGFADVTLGLRRLCTTAQKLPSTAADAAEVLVSACSSLKDAASKHRSLSVQPAQSKCFTCHEVTLGLRRLCTTAQKLPSTAADAAEVCELALTCMPQPQC